MHLPEYPLILRDLFDNQAGKSISHFFDPDYGCKPTSEFSFFRMSSEYTQVRPLGQGGCGKVTLVLDDRGILHAIKEGLDHHTGAQNLQLYQRECDALRSCSCMSVVRLLSHSEAGSLKLDLEFVPGGSLAMWLCQYNPSQFLTPTRLHIIFYGLARAIKVVHDLGIVHRDIKPGNVLLTHAFEPKLCDFGFARVLDGQKCSRVGTPFFMAPEMLAAEPRYTKAVDLYAFGRLIYTVLTGDDRDGSQPMGEGPYKDMVMSLTKATPDDRMSIEEVVERLEQVELFEGVVRDNFDDYKRRFEAYTQDDSELCTPEFLQVHQDDNAAVRYYLGILYTKGAGVDKNEKLGTELFESAASEGLRQAAELYVASQTASIQGFDERTKKELSTRWASAFAPEVLDQILDTDNYY